MLDNASYTVTLKKATVKSNDVNTLESLHITCVPALQKGKTYSWSEVTCKLVIFDFGSAYRDAIGKQYSGYITFTDNNSGIRTMTGSTGFSSFLAYSRTSSFGGCWSWWMILIIVLVILIIIAIVVALILKKCKCKCCKKCTKK